MAKKWNPPRDHKGRPVNEKGQEVFDPTPIDPPIGYTVQESMFDVVQRMISQHHARIQGMDEMDSPEEADDFEVGDDYDPSSPYEHDFDPRADLPELQRLRDALDGRIRELRGKEDVPPAPAAASPGSPASGGSGGGASGAGGGPAPSGSSSGPGPGGAAAT